jgi:hypothetical protein
MYIILREPQVIKLVMDPSLVLAKDVVDFAAYFFSLFRTVAPTPIPGNTA